MLIKFLHLILNYHDSLLKDKIQVIVRVKGARESHLRFQILILLSKVLSQDYVDGFVCRCLVHLLNVLIPNLNHLCHNILLVVVVAVVLEFILNLRVLIKDVVLKVLLA